MESLLSPCNSLSLSFYFSLNSKMQTLLSLSHSPSTPHVPNFTPRPKFPPLLHPFNAFSLPPSPPLLLTATKSSPFLISSPKLASFRLLAASISDARSDEPAKASGLVKTLQLGAMLALWYLLNIYFNIYNKQVLHFHPPFGVQRALKIWTTCHVKNDKLWTSNDLKHTLLRRVMSKGS